MTPKGGAKPSPVQRQKKQRLVVTKDTVTHAQSDMGMFWLHNPNIRMSKIFSQDMPKKVYILFCCRGKECERESRLLALFSILVHLRLSNLKQWNSLATISWQRRLAG
jgi:hypothetical protein